MDELLKVLAELLKEYAPYVFWFYIAAYSVFGVLFLAVFGFILRTLWSLHKGFDDFNKPTRRIK